MDFQFIHSVAKGAYVDLPSAKPVPNAYLTELRKYAGTGDGINTEIGSCYSYLTIKPGNEAAVAFFNRIERKKNARYPCNYIQSAGWTVHEDLLLNDFDIILTQIFFTEDQVDSFVNNSQVPPVVEQGQCMLPKVNIHRDSLRAVMYGCFRHWQMNSAPVRIAVPQNETQNYNEYVLGAIKEIYSYFPSYMRAAIGFCSYMLPQHAVSYPRFGIIFIPQAEADVKTILLDGSSHSAYEAISHTTGLKELDRMIEHILNLDDPVQRKQYLYSIYQITESKTKSKGFKPMDYRPMGEFLQLLEADGSVQELIPIWITYINNKQSYPADISQELDQLINKKLTVEGLQKYTDKALPEKPTLKELINLEVSLLQLCAGREDCQQGVWKDFLTRLKKNRYPAEQIYNMLLAEEETLAALVGKERVEQELANRAHDIAYDHLNREVAEMRQLANQTSNLEELREKLKKKVGTFSVTISAYANGSLKEEMCATVQAEADKLMQGKVNNAFQQLKSSTIQTQTEIVNALKTVSQLITVLPNTNDSLSTREDLQIFQDNLQRQKYRSQTIRWDLINQVSTEKNYFSALSKVSENIVHLSTEDAKLVKEQLKKCRPLTRSAYFSAFKVYFGTDFSAAALRGKPDFLKNTVIEDLASYYGQPQEISLANKDTTSLLKELHALEHDAEYLGVKSALRISLGKNVVEEAEVIEQLCELRCWSKLLTAQKFTSISEILLRNGIYRKEQLSGLIDLAMYLKADLKPLMGLVLEGNVRGMEKEDYQRFVDMLCASLVQSGSMSKAEALGRICAVARKNRLDGDAAKVIRGLQRNVDEVNRRKKLRIIFAAVAAVLVVIGTALTLWKLHVFPFAKPIDVISTEDSIQNAFFAGAQSGSFDVSQLGLNSSVRRESADAPHDDLEYIARYYRGKATITEQTEEMSVFPLTLADLEQLHLGFLSTLNLSGNRELTSVSALSGLKGIKELKLDGCTGLRPEAMKGLKGVSELEYLSLTNIPDITEVLVAEIVHNNNSGCVVRWSQNGQEMCYLDGNCLQINNSEWTLSGVARLNRLRPLLAELQGLRCLKLSGARLTTEDLAVVWALQGLEYLELSGTNISDGQLMELLAEDDTRTPQKLRVLVLRNNPELSESAVERFKTALPTGCYIDLKEDTVVSTEVLFLAGESFPRDITTLDLHGRRLSSDDLDAISRMSSLTTLNLANTGITELPDMSALTELIILDASGNDLSNADLGTIQQLVNLQELRLVGCGLEGIPDLYHSRNLARADLSGNPLTFDGLCNGSDRGYRLRFPDTLSTLKLASCGLEKMPSVLPENLEILDLSGNSFETDLNVLNHLAALRELRLSQCGLSALCDLRALSSLEILDLSGNVFEKLSVSESLPYKTLKGLSIARNGAENIDLTELYVLADLEWLDLTGVNNAVQNTWDDEQSRPISDIIGFVLDSIPGLKVLIFEKNDDLHLDQYDYSNCIIISGT